jgi:predicted TIM-barrel fold metal-dependent hydrolase
MMPRVVDGLSLVGESLFGPSQGTDSLIGQMNRLGVDTTVVAANRPLAYNLRPANEALADAVVASNGRLIGLARLDPNQPSAPGDLVRAFTHLGLSGLFLHPREEVYVVTDSRVSALLEVCTAHRRPVVVACGYPWVSEALQLGEVASRFPEITFVMTNGGQFNISGLGQFDVELALDEQPNLVIQTTGVYRQDFIERAAARYGAHRIMFASGSPNFDPEFELLRVTEAELMSEEDRELILGGTATAVYGLSA